MTNELDDIVLEIIHSESKRGKKIKSTIMKMGSTTSETKNNLTYNWIPRNKGEGSWDRKNYVNKYQVKFSQIINPQSQETQQPQGIKSKGDNKENQNQIAEKH